MPRKPGSGEPAWTDPDDAPELGAGFFKRADIFEGDRLVSRRRPGWQTRANAALTAWRARRPGT